MLRGACFYTDFIKRSICLGTIIAAVPQLRIQANRKLQIACRTLLGLTPLICPFDLPDPFDLPPKGHTPKGTPKGTRHLFVVTPMGQKRTKKRPFLMP